MPLTLRRVSHVQHSCILGMPATLDPRMKSIQAPRATWPWDFDHRRSRPQLAERAPCRFCPRSACIETTRPPLELFRGHRRENRLGGFLHRRPGRAAPLRTAYSPPAIRMPAHLLNGFMLYPAKPAESRFCDGRQDRTLLGAVTRHHRQALPGRARWSSQPRRGGSGLESLHEMEYAPAVRTARTTRPTVVKCNVAEPSAICWELYSPAAWAVTIAASRSLVAGKPRQRQQARRSAYGWSVGENSGNAIVQA